MATKKKVEPKPTVEQKEFDLREFTVRYKWSGNSEGVERGFEGWLIEQLENRFPVVSCDLEMSTRIRSLTFRR